MNLKELINPHNEEREAFRVDSKISEGVSNNYVNSPFNKIDKILEEVTVNLLNEAADLTTPESSIKAIQRGQVPGVKAKDFFAGRKELTIKATLETAINTVKAHDVGNNFNKYLTLLFSKARTINKLNSLSARKLEEVLDGFDAYFNNINKKEAKSIHKEKFVEFASSLLNVGEVKEFEQWANEAFAQKAKMKEGEHEIVYNKDGWEVIIPKTFAAAREFACMNSRKAKWCTAASSSYFKTYSGEDNPLYIIRNKEKNEMFQMDFGKRGRPNFKSEDDSSTSTEKLKEVNIPKDLLQSIKNKKGESVYDLIKHAIEPTINKNKVNKEDGWDFYVFDSIHGFLEEVRGLEMPNFLSGLSIENIMKNKSVSRFEEVGKVFNKKKTYYYFIPSKNAMTFNYKTMSKTVGRFILEKGKEKLTLKNYKTFFKLDLPDSIKKKLIDVDKVDSILDMEDLRVGKGGKEKTPMISNKSIKVYTSFNNIAEIATLDGLNERKSRELKRAISRKVDNVNKIVAIITDVIDREPVWYLFIKNNDVLTSSFNNSKINRALYTWGNKIPSQNKLEFINLLIKNKCAGVDKVPSSIISKTQLFKKGDIDYIFYESDRFKIVNNSNRWADIIHKKTGVNIRYGSGRGLSSEDKAEINKGELNFYKSIIDFLAF